MAKGKKRKARDSGIDEKQLLVPINILEFGSDKDPCYGKLYDLNAVECKSCGDIELCAIAMAQSNSVKRLEMEKTQAFKDLDMAPDHNHEEIKSYLRKNLHKHEKRGALILEAKKKFNVSRFVIKDLIKQIT